MNTGLLARDVGRIMFSPFSIHTPSRTQLTSTTLIAMPSENQSLPKPQWRIPEKSLSFYSIANNIGNTHPVFIAIVTRWADSKV